MFENVDKKVGAISNSCYGYSLGTNTIECSYSDECIRSLILSLHLFFLLNSCYLLFYSDVLSI